MNWLDKLAEITAGMPDMQGLMGPGPLAGSGSVVPQYRPNLPSAARTPPPNMLRRLALMSSPLAAAAASNRKPAGPGPLMSRDRAEAATLPQIAPGGSALQRTGASAAAGGMGITNNPLLRQTAGPMAGSAMQMLQGGAGQSPLMRAAGGAATSTPGAARLPKPQPTNPGNDRANLVANDPLANARAGLGH